MTLCNGTVVDSNADRRAMPTSVKQECIPSSLPSLLAASTQAAAAPAAIPFHTTLATQCPDSRRTSATTPTPPDQSMPSAALPPMDSASRHRIFGWTTLDGNVNIPHLLRGADATKYVSVRMVEMKLLSKYPSTYPEELKQRAPLVSQFVTADEARLLDEINGIHCEYDYGRAPFVSGRDLIVRLNEFEDFYRVVKKHFPEDVLKKLYGTAQSPAVSTEPVDGGWVQVNNTIVPYVLRRPQGRAERLVPLSVVRHAAGLLVSVQVPSEQPTTGECAYLDTSCRRAGVSFTFSPATKLVRLDVVARMCPKTAIVALPKGDPFGHARYVGDVADRNTTQGQFQQLQLQQTRGGPDVVPTANISHGSAENNSYTAVKRLQELTGAVTLGVGRLQQQQHLHDRQRPQLIQQQQPFVAHVPGNTVVGQPPFGANVGVYQGAATLDSSEQQQHIVQQQHDHLQRQQQQHQMMQQQIRQQQLMQHQQQQQLIQQQQQHQQIMQQQQHQLIQQKQLIHNRQQNQHLMQQQHQQQQRAQVMLRQPPLLYRHQLPVGVPSSSQTNGMNGEPRPLAHAPGIEPAAGHKYGATSIHQLRLEAYVNGAPPGPRQMSNGPPNMTTTNRLPAPQIPSRSPAVPVQPTTTSPVVLGQIVEMSSDMQRKEQAPTKAPKRKRIKDCFIDLTETEEPMASADDVADKASCRIQQFRFEGKTISCLERDGHNMALLEALCRVYFPQCTIDAFSEALGTALHAPISELSPAEEALFIIYYHLPTDALKCRRVVDIRHFASFFPQLTYMLQDRVRDDGGKATDDGGDAEVIFTEKVCLPDGVVATHGAPEPVAVAVAVPAPAGVNVQSGMPVVLTLAPAMPVLAPEPVLSMEASTTHGDGNTLLERLSSETQQTLQYEQQQTLPIENGSNDTDRETRKRMRLNEDLVSTSSLAATPSSLVDILNRASPRTTTTPRGSPSASMVPMPNGVVSVELSDCKNGIVSTQTKVSNKVADNDNKLVICID